jgi:hypothetical protein
VTSQMPLTAARHLLPCPLHYGCRSPCSVDRPRCQPGLCFEAYLCLYAAAQISAGRQARARSTSSPGEPAAVWRSTEEVLSR